MESTISSEIENVEELIEQAEEAKLQRKRDNSKYGNKVENDE